MEFNFARSTCCFWTPQTCHFTVANETTKTHECVLEKRISEKHTMSNLLRAKSNRAYGIRTTRVFRNQGGSGEELDPGQRIYLSLRVWITADPEVEQKVFNVPRHYARQTRGHEMQVSCMSTNLEAPLTEIPVLLLLTLPPNIDLQLREYVLNMRTSIVQYQSNLGG